MGLGRLTSFHHRRDGFREPTLWLQEAEPGGIPYLPPCSSSVATDLTNDNDYAAADYQTYKKSSSRVVNYAFLQLWEVAMARNKESLEGVETKCHV